MNDYLSYVEDLRGSKFRKSMINDWMKGGEEHTVEELEKILTCFFTGIKRKKGLFAIKKGKKWGNE